MIDPPDQERLEDEQVIRIFLKLYSILAAHFEAKHTGGLFGLGDGPIDLAHKYDEAARDELQGDADFVAALPSVTINPLVKESIAEEG